MNKPSPHTSRPSPISTSPLRDSCRSCRLPAPQPRTLLAPLLILWLVFCLPAPLRADAALPHDFATFRLGEGKRVVLVIGGIQGDEPGGFSAATLLATRYEIQAGALWVVPNLNFPSIIKRSRGIYGDMNRKFARLDRDDPQFPTVSRIQQLIRDPAVALVLNLHDGSGYYRPRFESKLCSPARWGQSVIIDQAQLPDAFLGDLAQVAERVTEEVNGQLLRPLHKLHVHNTRTAEGDREMEKSLSYFAVRHGKAAFGLEASKEFPVALRTYYHLHMVEAFMRQAGLRFTRDFSLTPRGIDGALRTNLGVSFAENRVFLPLEDVRGQINYLPLPKGSPATAVTSNPIMAVLPCQNDRGTLCIHYGNRTITCIKPDWRELDTSLGSIEVSVDGRRENLIFGRVLDVFEGVRIHAPAGYRVNAIGYDSGKRDENGLLLRRSLFEKRFSVDRGGTLFRVEIYKNDRFAGLFLLRFREGKPGNRTGSPQAARLSPDLTGTASGS